MSKESWIRRRWKLLLNIVTLLAFVGLLIAIRDQVGETVSNIRHVQGWLLFMIIPLAVLNYHAQAKLYQGLFSVVGNKLDYKLLFKMALELNFVNHVFPSGGVTGISYFSLRMRQGKELTGSKATLVHFMKLMLQFLSFELLIIIALLSLSLMGRISNFTMLVAATISTLLLVGTVMFGYIVGSRSRINSFFTAVTKVLNRLIQFVRPKHPETINTAAARRVFDDFHDNYKLIRSSYAALKRPFWYAFLANATEVTAVYSVFLAFGHPVNVGAVILAYAVANFAGLVSVLPGGVGIYEALMAAVLSSAGVPIGVSLPAIVMFRVISTIIQIPPGYFLYHRALSQGSKSQEAGYAA